jgi:hypothetical protein
MYPICSNPIYADDKDTNAQVIYLVEGKKPELNMANPISFQTECQEKCGHTFHKMDYQSCCFEGHPVVLCTLKTVAVLKTQQVKQPQIQSQSADMTTDGTTESNPCRTLSHKNESLFTQQSNAEKIPTHCHQTGTEEMCQVSEGSSKQTNPSTQLTDQNVPQPKKHFLCRRWLPRSSTAQINRHEQDIP